MLSGKYPQLVRDLLAIGQCFIQQPRESFQLLRTLPEMLAGSFWAKRLPREAQPDLGISTDPSPALFANQNPLAQYFHAHTQGRGIWKITHYLDIYHQYFSKFVGRDVNIVEIGIFSGGSLEMWRNYFGPKCKVYGIDIRDECRAYANDQIEIFIGDQADRRFWTSFKDQVSKVDIVIDDGGHLSHQQIVTLEEMLPHLQPGGVYLCEDIVTVPNRFPAYIHGLIRQLNAFNYRPSQLEVDTTTFQRYIHSIHLYPYVMVIEKSAAPVECFELPMQGTEWQPIADAGTQHAISSAQL